MHDDRPPSRRRPMENRPNTNTLLGRAHRPPPTPEQIYNLLENNNRLLLGIVARLERIETTLREENEFPI